ncbi:glycosyltransferase family 4 protein [Salegentibacter sp. F188]|uniref:Glycosyltransferase family 4 protein n=1 Tax=Autumnicola patrickiae TaxID=3075591 RepID=A0ABU3DXM2_9FLAO|nr:glycosyltransferase family 4 protein [Salegentibacter sp. F188]MDT0688478.1 glycosyltransferase family 4 protein [Salegentibacter sp. F188]
MITILHLSAVKKWGGGEKHIETLCRELPDVTSKIHNIVLCTKELRFSKDFYKTDPEIIPAPLSFKMDPRFIAKIIRVCKQKKIDIVHIHDSTALTLYVIANQLASLPPAVFSKKTSFPIRPRKQTLFKYNSPQIEKIFCVSKATAAIASENIEDKNKICCIYHGTNLKDKDTSTPFILQDKLQLKKGTRIIGNIANHIWPKSLETFILVAEELIHKQQLKNIHFVQIGEFSSLSPPLLKMIKKLKLEEQVTFMGKLENAANFIPQFDLSLMTSQSEGVPQFIYESFYHQIPVVSTDVGGISEVIEHGVNGLLAPAFDVKKLAAHIVSLLNNQQDRKNFVRISRQKLESNFTSAIMAENTYSEYKKVLNER